MEKQHQDSQECLRIVGIEVSKTNNSYTLFKSSCMTSNMIRIQEAGSQATGLLTREKVKYFSRLVVKLKCRTIARKMRH